MTTSLPARPHPAAGSVAGLHRVRIVGLSMTPTYRPGDMLLCRRLSGRPVQPGMPVVLWAPENSPFAPGSLLVKRVVAVSGDPLPDFLGGPRDRLVPKGRVVLTGDNRQYSYDSRSAGLLFAESELLSRVLFRLFRGLPAVRPGGRTARQ